MSEREENRSDLMVDRSEWHEGLPKKLASILLSFGAGLLLVVIGVCWFALGGPIALTCYVAHLLLIVILSVMQVYKL